MQSTEMTRTEMIGKLVALSVSTATTESKHLWLNNIFENGFIGYNKFSDRRLLMELELRGMALSDDTDCDDTVDDTEADAMQYALSEDSTEDAE